MQANNYCGSAGHYLPHRQEDHFIAAGNTTQPVCSRIADHSPSGSSCFALKGHLVCLSDQISKLGRCFGAEAMWTARQTVVCAAVEWT